MASAPLVLCYHAVSDRWLTHSPCPRVLLEQVRRLLGRGLRPVDAAEILDRPAGSFHVTFDDAYRNIEQVLPDLRTLGAGVTVFASLRPCLRRRAARRPEVAPRAVGHEKEILTMDWEALRRAAALGVEIGSHTRSHPHLTRLSDDDLQAELTGSREALEANLQASAAPRVPVRRRWTSASAGPPRTRATPRLRPRRRHAARFVRILAQTSTGATAGFARIKTSAAALREGGRPPGRLERPHGAEARSRSGSGPRGRMCWTSARMRSSRATAPSRSPRGSSPRPASGEACPECPARRPDRRG